MKNKYIYTLIILAFSINALAGWEIKSSMSVKRTGAVAVTFNDKIFVIGGKNNENGYLKRVDLYDPVTDTWDTTSVPDIYYKRAYAAALVYNDSLFVIGGRNDSDVLKSVEVYTAAQNTWVEVQHLRREREGAFAVVFNDRPYVFGGADHNGYLEEEVEWWDKTESDWKESAIVFNPPRASAFNFVWSDTLYISGGYYFSPLLTTLKLAPDGTWRNGIDLPQPRAGGATALIGSHAYFIGGETNSGVTSNMDIYNLVSNSILTGTSLLAPRAGHAIASYDEIIYVFGGHGTSSSYILNTVLAFDSRVTGIDDHLPAQNPESIAIVSNYPNPFNGSTNIQFELNKNTLVDLNIFNIQGQKIREIVKGNFAAGKYNFTWNGKSFLGNSVSSGLYILVLQTDNQKIKRKIMYLK